MMYRCNSIVKAATWFDRYRKGTRASVRLGYVRGNTLMIFNFFFIERTYNNLSLSSIDSFKEQNIAWLFYLFLF